jgi:hypothetical protein
VYKKPKEDKIEGKDGKLFTLHLTELSAIKAKIFNYLTKDEYALK